MYLFELWFSPDICIGEGWLGHMETLFLVFFKNIHSKLEELTCLPSDYTTKLHSSRQYGTGIKTEI